MVTKRVMGRRQNAGMQPSQGVDFCGSGACNRPIKARIVVSLVLAGWLRTFGASQAPHSPSLPPGLPVQVDDSLFHTLWTSRSPDLQRRLDGILEANPVWKRLVRTRRMAVGVVDMDDPSRPRAAWIQGNLMMYAASLPKIAILLAAVQAFEEGALEETAEVMDDLSRMIRYSDNEATTRIIDLLGFDRIGRAVTHPDWKFYDRVRGGGLWVGKRYAREGPRKGDPLKGISHAATVSQVCRFYYLAATGRLISPERSGQILRILREPGVHHKFVHALETRHPVRRLFRQSGTWKHWHSDSVLVWGEHPGHRYILVALVQAADGESILRELAASVDDAFGAVSSSP